MRTESSEKSTNDGQIVSKALLRAAELLEITNSDLSKIIGVSPSTITRMGKGDAFVHDNKKEFEHALLFIRLYRSLDAIMGGDDRVSASWLKNSNDALGGVPLELIKKVDGLVNVVAYLDSRRAKI